MAAAAIRTYFQCEACSFGSFEIKEIELHMHETHTHDQVAAAAAIVAATAIDVDGQQDDVESSAIIADKDGDVALVYGEEADGDDNDVDDDDDAASSVVDAVPQTSMDDLHSSIIVKSGGGGGGVVDSNSDSDPSDVIWSNGAVRLLIGLVRENLDKFASPSTPKHYLWKGISWKMSEKGYSYTHVRCDNKWRSLKKTYRNARQLVRAGKVDAKKWKFYDVMDEFMAEQELEVDNGTSTGVAITDDAGTRRGGGGGAGTAASRKRRKPGGASATDAEEADYKIETDRERRHREKMEQMKRFNDLFELFVSNNKSVDHAHQT